MLTKLRLENLPIDSKNPRRISYIIKGDRKEKDHAFVMFNEEHKKWIVKIGPDPFYNILAPWGVLITGRLVKSPDELMYESIEKAFSTVRDYFEEKLALKQYRVNEKTGKETEVIRKKLLYEKMGEKQ